MIPTSSNHRRTYIRSCFWTAFNYIGAEMVTYPQKPPATNQCQACTGRQICQRPPYGRKL